MVRGRAWGKAATGRPKLQEKGSKDMIQLAGDTYGLFRGKKTRGMGGRSRGHGVRRQAWGKAVAAAGRPKLQEKDSKDMIHMAKNTYGLRRGKKTRGMGGRCRGHVVRGRAWDKAAAGRP